MAEKITECKNHEWIPLLGVSEGKTVPTSLFTCLKCGDLKVGTQTIKISRYRLDMGELPINSVAAIKLTNPPTADATASGLVIAAQVDSNAYGIGAPLFMNSDGHLDTADADSTTTSPCVALALETGTGSKKVLVHGILTLNAWTSSPYAPTGWVTGPGGASLIYLSTDNQGLLTQTKPSGTDDVIQPVGWALSSTCIYFAPSMIYLTHV